MSRNTDRVLNVNAAALGFGAKAAPQRFQLGAGGILMPAEFMGSVGFPAFNPLNLPSGQHWTAVWDLASCTQAGGLISAVADLTGNGHTLTAAGAAKPGYTAANPAGNNQPSADFSGVKYLVSNGLGLTTGNFTMLVVGSGDLFGGDACFMTSNPDSTRLMTNGAFLFETGDTTSTLVQSTTAVANAVAIIIAELSGATSKLHWSEATPDAANANTPDLTGATMTLGNFATGIDAGFTQGGSTFWAGVIPGVLSTADKAYLNAGFSSRFGVAIGP